MDFISSLFRNLKMTQKTSKFRSIKMKIIDLKILSFKKLSTLNNLEIFQQLKFLPILQVL
jgi:hypothetical protein